jgi:integrase
VKRPLTGQSTDLVTVLEQRVSLAATLANPDITLARACATYLLYKQRRLTPASKRGYQAVVDQLTKNHPGVKLSEFEPPNGTFLLEDFLNGLWGLSAPRTYNKSHSILSDLFKWHVARGTLLRDPMATIERAKTRPVPHRVFTDAEIVQILARNTAVRDQIALRLLLFFGIRKGALRGIRFEHFNPDRRQLIVFTKGEKFHTLPIVDDTVWKLLADLDEPAEHYLLPKQKSRKRVPPTRRQLRELGDALRTAQAVLPLAAADPFCAGELADVLDALQMADVRLKVAVQAASTQVRVEPAEPIGEHGAHLWWYRCLARAGVVSTGVTAGRRMHGARHTSIQRVLERTGNLRAAQTLAGHATVSTTELYTDWNDQLEQTMREVLG